MKKTIFYINTLILGASLLGATLLPQSLQASPKGGIVRIVSVGEPSVLNPVFDTTPAAQDMYNLIFSGLLKENSRGELEADLLEVVPTTGNGMIRMQADGSMVVKYRLRHGLKWQDGQPLQAEDILFTWQMHTDPKVKYPPTPGYEQIRMVEVVDAQTALVHFHRAYGDYYRLFQHILPRHSFRSVHWKFAANHPYNKHPVGSGPFVLKDWDQGQSALLNANPLYHRSRPQLDQIRYEFKPENYQAIKGSLDWVDQADIMQGLSITAYDYLKNRSELNLHVVANGQIEYLLFNMQDPILTDRRVRRALAYATDRKAISDLLLGLAEPAYSDQLRDSWKYNPKTELFYDPDLKQARLSLEAGGWKHDKYQTSDETVTRKKDGQELKLELALEMGNKSHQLVGAYLKEAWKKIGVDLTLKTVAPAILRTDLQPKGDFQITLGTWTQAPAETAYKRWHSTQTPPAGMNYSSINDYQIDTITRELQSTVNLAHQKKLYAELGTLVAEQVPVLPLYYGAELEANRKSLHNYFPNAHAGATWNSHSWWLE